MRVGRYVLAIAMMTTGAVIARPDDVIPLATKLAASLKAMPAPREAKVDAAHHPIVTAQTFAQAEDTDGRLPAFVATSHDLSMPAKDARVGEAPRAAANTGQAEQIAPVEDGAATDAAAPAPSAARPPAAGETTGERTGKGAGTAGEGASKTAALKDPVDNSLDLSGQKAKSAAVDEAVAESVQGTPLLPAKKLFGVVKGPSLLQARAIGTYSRGCLAGATALPVDGPAWQAMRLSRNRNWGHPRLIELVEKFAVTAQKEDGWSGLLVGDISQPRGGPMLTGHASHQLGLDADIWFTPMPRRTLTRQERETIAATSMLDKTDLAVDSKVFTEKHVALIKRAASYAEVERVLVHPAIKKALCQSAGVDRGWLGKVRPIQGHYYHFHIRIGCPSGSVGCVSQKSVTGEDGCGKEVDEWLERLARAKLPPPPKPPGWKPPPPTPPVTMSQLPADCRMVLESGADGIDVPDHAMLPPRPAKSEKQTKKSAPLVKATVTLRPVGDRRSTSVAAPPSTVKN